MTRTISRHPVVRGSTTLLLALGLWAITAGTSSAQTQTCKAGIDCCYIAASPHNPPRYSMAWDQTVGSGMTVLLSSGFVRIVFGPASGAACLTYWSANIAPMQGYSPWRVGAGSAMTDGTPTPLPGPQPVGPVAGGSEPPRPTPTPTPDKVVGPQPVGPAPVAGGPPPASGYWQLIDTRTVKRGHVSTPGKTLANELSIQEGAMSATFTETGDYGPSTWKASASWSWNTPSGLARFIPGEKIEVQLDASDHSVPETKSGWRLGQTGVGCVIRWDQPGLDAGITADSAKDIVSLNVGEQKAATQKASIAVPAGPGDTRWNGKSGLVANCASMGKFERVYQWIPPGGAPVAQGGTQPSSGGGTATTQQQPNPPQPFGQQSPQPIADATTGTPVLPPWQGGQPPLPQPLGSGATPGLPPVSGSVQSFPQPSDDTSQPGPGPTPNERGPTPASIQRVTKVFDNWNTASCALTSTAQFKLDAPTQITNVELWYNWQRGEAVVPFEINVGGQSIARGQLARGACDPNQAAWCTATASFSAIAAAGSYAVRVPTGRLCQNSGSQNNGFVRVRGMQ